MNNFDPTIPGYLTSVDPGIVNKIYQYYLANKKNWEFKHPSTSHHLIHTAEDTPVQPGSEPVSNNWDIDLHEELEYLKHNTYPFGADIYCHWIKTYDETHHHAGGFLGLHQDWGEFAHLKNEGKMLITNSILLHQSDDLEGGELIFAGDSFDNTKDNVSAQERPYNTKHIMHRMEVEKHKNIGDVMWWHGYTVHGVSRIKKGNRVTFMIIKTTDIDDIYFKKERNG